MTCGQGGRGFTFPMRPLGGRGWGGGCEHACEDRSPRPGQPRGEPGRSATWQRFRICWGHLVLVFWTGGKTGQEVVISTGRLNLSPGLPSQAQRQATCSFGSLLCCGMRTLQRFCSFLSFFFPLRIAACSGHCLNLTPAEVVKTYLVGNCDISNLARKREDMLPKKGLVRPKKGLARPKKKPSGPSLRTEAVPSH